MRLPELYDIARDKSETDNQANRNPQVVARLAPQLLAWGASLPKGDADEGAGQAGYPWPRAKAAPPA